MTSRLTGLLVLALALGAVVAGCGDSGEEGGSTAANTSADSGASSTVSGGSDSAPDPATAVTGSSTGKTEFVKQANAACKTGKDQLLGKIVAYQSKNLNNPSVGVVSTAVRTIVRPTLEAEVDKIRDIGVPSADAAEIEAYFESLLGGVDAILVRRPQTFAEAERLLQAAADEAQSYGLDQCDWPLEDEQFNARVLNSE